MNYWPAVVGRTKPVLTCEPLGRVEAPGTIVVIGTEVFMTPAWEPEGTPRYWDRSATIEPCGTGCLKLFGVWIMDDWFGVAYITLFGGRPVGPVDMLMILKTKKFIDFIVIYSNLDLTLRLSF